MMIERDGHSSKLQIEEIIVVEGIHDKQAVDRVCEAEVWVIGGDRVARSFINSLEKAAAVRGIIILTDPDGAGNRIRQRLLAAVPAAKQAFIPRAEAVGSGGLGVEHASDEAIRKALENARPTVRRHHLDAFTMADLISSGLAGNPQAAQRRQQVGEALGIGYGNAQAFLRKLNTLDVSREQFEAAVSHLSNV